MCTSTMYTSTTCTSTMCTRIMCTSYIDVKILCVNAMSEYLSCVLITLARPKSTSWLTIAPNKSVHLPSFSLWPSFWKWTISMLKMKTCVAVLKSQWNTLHWRSAGSSLQFVEIFPHSNHLQSCLPPYLFRWRFVFQILKESGASWLVFRQQRTVISFPCGTKNSMSLKDLYW